MRLKIHNTEVVSFRVSGELYFEVMKRADAKKITVGEYAKHALIKYMEYKEPKKREVK